MVKRVFAAVKPEILVWARTSAGFTLEAASTSLKIDATMLASWEADGGEKPSVPQLRRLAELYKRPLAVFYLQEVPRQFQVVSDLRLVVPGEDRAYSPLLTHEIRVAQQRRELALELRDELDEPAKPFPFRLGNESPEQAGELIRRFLGIEVVEIAKFGTDPNGRLGFNRWRAAIEQSGVLVFQSSRVPEDEASGFALAYDVMPVVVINRKDVPQRRLFSLLHEFAHIALRQSGVSDLKLYPARSQAFDIEIRCNVIAAAALMPKDELLRELNATTGDERILTDEAINRLARRFGVSRPALLIRLISQRVTDWDFYFQKVGQYRRDFERELKARPPLKNIKRNIPQESIGHLGRPFIGLVLGNYHQRRITLSEVAGYLGVRVKHIPALQQRFMG